MNGLLFGLFGAVLAYVALGGLLRLVSFEKVIAAVVSISLLIGIVEVIL